MRITAQLIKAADGFHVWAENFDRELKDIFAVQDEIAGLIAQQLQLKLADAPVRARTVDPEAHQLYLQGKYFANQPSTANLAKAVDFLQRSVDLDPPSRWLGARSVATWRCMRNTWRPRRKPCGKDLRARAAQPTGHCVGPETS